jgi:16S rRNA processing protein RimM
VSDEVLLAIIRRARGIRGEVVVETFGSRPDRFQPGMRVFMNGSPVEVESAWVHDGHQVLKFGAELAIPLEERPPAPEGEYYLSDLVGCRVETVEGRHVGEVASYLDQGAQPLLTVKREGREILVPFVEGIYRRVDVDGRLIVVELPEGLEDLNG